MKPDAAQEGTTAVSSRWMSRLAVAFWVAVAVWVAAWVVAPHCHQKVTLDFAAATRREHLQGLFYAAHFDQRLPKDAYVLEDVRELSCGTAVGLCQLDRAARVVYWSSSDGTNPLSNGRHYRLVGVRRWRADKITLAIAALVPLLLALVLSMWRRWGRIAEAAGWRRQLVDAIDLHGKSPRWLRWALAVVVLLGFLPVVTSTWNRYAIDTDTWDYCHGTFNRTPLTYFFLKTFDPHCDAVSTQDPRTLLGVFHDAHSDYLAQCALEGAVAAGHCRPGAGAGSVHQRLVAGRLDLLADGNNSGGELLRSDVLAGSHYLRAAVLLRRTAVSGRDGAVSMPAPPVLGRCPGWTAGRGGVGAPVKSCLCGGAAGRLVGATAARWFLAGDGANGAFGDAAAGGNLGRVPVQPATIRSIPDLRVQGLLPDRGGDADRDAGRCGRLYRSANAAIHGACA